MRRMDILHPLLPTDRVLPLLVNLVWNGLVYWGARQIASGWPHHTLALPFEERIPFLPWTVSIYLGCYLFWAVNYLLACRQERGAAYRFLAAEFLAKGICLLCFLFLPTTLERPEVTGDGIWRELMRLLYRMDAADNLFPSIHCLVSWFCVIGIREQPKVPLWYRVASVGLAASVCASTLTTKQHVLADVAAGVLLAELCWRVTDRIGFTAFYERACERAAGCWKKIGRVRSSCPADSRTDVPEENQTAEEERSTEERQRTDEEQKTDKE